MKLLLITPPFSGHLHPMLRIGIHLKAYHEVTILSTPAAKASIEAAELGGVYCLVNKEEIIFEIANPSEKAGNNPFRLYKQLKLHIGLLGDLKQEISNYIQSNPVDVILADFTQIIVGPIAEKHQIPWLTVSPSPCSYQSRSGPFCYMGGVMPRQDLFGYVRDWLHSALTRSFKKLMFLTFRTSFLSLGLRSVYRKDGSEVIYSPTKYFALGTDEFEFERVCYPGYEQIGPVLYTPPFPQAGPHFDDDKSYVLVTLGTHLPHEKEVLLEQVKVTARQFPHLVFHFTYGDQSRSLPGQVGNVEVYPYISYLHFLKNYTLVVHHGGAGITYACIKEGVPAVCYPVDYDQFDFAARIVHAGVGVHMKNKKDLSELIRKVLVDETMTRKVKALQHSLKRYTPLEKIQQELERLEKVNGYTGVR